MIGADFKVCCQLLEAALDAHALQPIEAGIDVEPRKPRPDQIGDDSQRTGINLGHHSYINDFAICSEGEWSSRALGHGMLILLSFVRPSVLDDNADASPNCTNASDR